MRWIGDSALEKSRGPMGYGGWVLLVSVDALNADWLTLARTEPRGPIEDAEVTDARLRQDFSDSC